jgi:protein-tyrosine-phosphatase
MLKEVGLEIPDHAPRLLTPEMMEEARVRVTMGCMDDASCPAKLKTLEVEDWALEDPTKLDDAGFRRVRDEVIRRVMALRIELRQSDRRIAGRTSDAAQ